MGEISAFSGGDLFVFALVAIGYFLGLFAPALYSTFVVLRRKPVMPRRLLFVALVIGLSYGALSFIGFAIDVPTTAYIVFIAPQLEATGHYAGQPFLSLGRFVTQYWWLGFGPALLLVSVAFTNYLARRWTRIVEAIRG